MPTMYQLLTEIRADLHEFTQTVWRDPDIAVWINEGIQAIVAETHGMLEDWLTRRMLSTDSSETIQGELYNPTNLTIIANTSLYTLPPNVLQIRSLEPLSNSDRDAGVAFLPKSPTHPEFLRAARITATQIHHHYFYAVVGPRTLRIVPTPYTSTSITTELWYVAMPERLTISDTVTALPIQAMKAVKAYAVWLAMQSINSPDVNSKRNVYEDMLREFRSMLSPRQTNDPKFVEGAFDEEDSVHSLPY